MSYLTTESRISPQEMKAQCEGAVRDLNIDNESMIKARESVTDFIHNDKLQAKGIKALKGTMDRYLPYIDGLIEANDADINDFNTLSRTVEGHDLNGYQIIKGENESRSGMNRENASADDYERKSHSAGIFASMYRAWAEGHRSRARSYKRELEHWQAKRAEYDSIEEATRNLFIIGAYFRSLLLADPNDPNSIGLKIPAGYPDVTKLIKDAKDKVRVAYGDYLTEDEAVNKEILKTFNEYGDDLSGLGDDVYDKQADWETASKNRKKAYTRIFEVDIEKIDSSWSDKECEVEEKRVSNIMLNFLAQQPSENEGAVFNEKHLREMYSYSESKTAQEYMIKMSKSVCENYTWLGGFDVKLHGAGIVVEPYDIAEESMGDFCYVTRERAERYIKHVEETDKNAFEYTRKFLPNNEDIAVFYASSKNTADVDFIDALMKTDGDYKYVFSKDPEKLSGQGVLSFAKYGRVLLNQAYEGGSGAKEAEEAYENFMNRMCAANPEIHSGFFSVTYENLFLEKYAAGASILTDSIVRDIKTNSFPPEWWMDEKLFPNLSDEERKENYDEAVRIDKAMWKELEIAKLNEKLAFTLNGAYEDSINEGQKNYNSHCQLYGPVSRFSTN